MHHNMVIEKPRKLLLLLVIIENQRKLETIALLAQVDDSESAATADQATEGGSCSLLI